MSTRLATPLLRTPADAVHPERSIDLMETVFVGVLTQALAAIPLLCVYAIVAA